MPASEPLDDLQTSLLRLGRLLASRQAATRLVEVAGIQVSQQGVALLRALRREGRVPAAELAAAAGMDLGAVSRQVRLLEQDDLVSRSADPDDGRVVLLELTGKGQATAERLHAIGARHLEAALADWSEVERTALAASLDRLVDDLRATPLGGGAGT
ncbi:MAG: MarR family transcriptional regulator [Acidimicrobiales bacterium]|nr:MarR family transcriptional regulator [Acidimicrobiales bacterium]